MTAKRAKQSLLAEDEEVCNLILLTFCCNEIEKASQHAWDMMALCKKRLQHVVQSRLAVVRKRKFAFLSFLQCHSSPDYFYGMERLLSARLGLPSAKTGERTHHILQKSTSDLKQNCAMPFSHGGNFFVVTFNKV